MKKVFWEIFLRLTSESSAFFNYLGGALVIVSATGVGLGAMASTIIVWKGQSLQNLLIIAGVVGATICRLTVRNNAVLNAQVEQKVSQ